MFSINKDGVKIHTTKDGVEIALIDMSNQHLLNVLKFIRKHATEGLLVQWGCMDWDVVDYDEYLIFGEQVLQELNYYSYLEEFNRRKNHIL